MHKTPSIADTNRILVNAAGIEKSYRINTRDIRILKGIDFIVKKGEFVSIMGPSGSGKSTLLYILGCLDRPTAGSYLLDGVDVLNVSDRYLSKLRANRIGFVFQTFNLVPALTLYENVELPFFYSSISPDLAEKRISAAIDKVGLRHRIHHKASELSGGEMQRVAIARALSIEPMLILADEPTGNLDTDTGREILGLFRDLHGQGATIIMVTHDDTVANCADRCVRLKDGRSLSPPPL
jgi:putative ABC transport system ATP-binding protein